MGSTVAVLSLVLVCGFFAWLHYSTQLTTKRQLNILAHLTCHSCGTMYGMEPSQRRMPNTLSIARNNGNSAQTYESISLDAGQSIAPNAGPGHSSTMNPGNLSPMLPNSTVHRTRAEAAHAGDCER